MNEEAIFTEAIALQTAQERSDYVARVCGDRAARERIELLLRLHDSELAVDHSAMELIDPKGESAGTGLVGQSIGQYRLLEQIGEGGMGVVYLAEQKHPVRRRVALKVVKPGMDTRQVIARFESERQALALMEHENIARVLDAGETDEGRPFFVMELVRGIPVTEFCRQEQLTLTERLELFVDTCGAVQHAHLKGIIHRDIKPSNVMITLHDGKPTVKMIDFGVAKAISQNLTDRTLFTNVTQLIGTPLYTSPEQAGLNGLDVDTRSDVYSLGVLLYELLTGCTPFDEERFRTLSYDEMRRVIREEEPVRPSLRGRKSDAADKTDITNDRPETGDPVQFCSGELDWIVLKALEKQRSRRYQTASDLAGDVRRYLTGEPVEACPPSATYRLRKWLSRHRALVLSSGTAVVSLVTACCISVWFAVEARYARNTAEQAQQVAEANEVMATEINMFLREDLLGQASPYRNPDRDLRLREVLERASERIGTRFSDQPLVEAGIRTTLGTTYLHLGELDRAAIHLEKAHALQVQHLGPQDAVTLRTEYYLGHTAYWSSGPDEALEIWLRTLERQQKNPVGDAVDAADKYITMNWVGWCYAIQNRLDLAETTLVQAESGLARILGPEHAETLECLDARTRLLWMQGRKEDAADMAQHVLKTLKKTVGEQHPQYQNMLSAIAEAKLQQGENVEALTRFRQILEDRRRIQGADHPETLHEEGAVARSLLASDQFDNAEKLFLDILHRHRERYGDEHKKTLSTMRWLSQVYRKRGDYASAVTLLREVLDVDQRTLQADDQQVITDLQLLADIFRLAKQHEDAAQTYAQLAQAAETRDDLAHRIVRDALLRQAEALRSLRKTADMAKVVETIQTRLGTYHPDTLRVQLDLARLYKAEEDYQTAEKLFAAVWTLPAELLERTHKHRLWAGINLVDVWRRQGHATKAKPVCRDVVERHQELYGDTVGLAYPLAVQGKIFQELEDWDAATDCYVRSFHLRMASNSDDPQAKSLLAELSQITETLEQRKDRPAAARVLGRIHSMLVREFGEGSEQAVRTLSKQARTYGEMKDWTKAREAAERELHLRRHAEWQRFPPVNTTQFVAFVLVQLEEFAEAETLIRRGLADWESWRPRGERRFLSVAVLGDALTGQGRYDEAEQVLTQAHREMTEQNLTKQHLQDAVLHAFIRLYDASGNADRGRFWRAQLTDDAPTR